MRGDPPWGRYAHHHVGLTKTSAVELSKVKLCKWGRTYYASLVELAQVKFTNYVNVNHHRIVYDKIYHNPILAYIVHICYAYYHLVVLPGTYPTGRFKPRGSDHKYEQKWGYHVGDYRWKSTIVEILCKKFHFVFNIKVDDSIYLNTLDAMLVV
jgi:hypothetical protein